MGTIFEEWAFFEDSAHTLIKNYKLDRRTTFQGLQTKFGVLEEA